VGRDGGGIGGMTQQVIKKEKKREHKQLQETAEIA
jgi:hypothetical protein